MSDVDAMLNMSESLREGFAKVQEQLSARGERLSILEQNMASNTQAIQRLFKIVDGNEAKGTLSERITRLEDMFRSTSDSLKSKSESRDKELSASFSEIDEDIDKLDERISEIEKEAKSITWKLIGLLLTAVTGLIGWIATAFGGIGAHK